MGVIPRVSNASDLHAYAKTLLVGRHGDRAEDLALDVVSSIAYVIGSAELRDSVGVTVAELRTYLVSPEAVGPDDAHAQSGTVESQIRGRWPFEPEHVASVALAMELGNWRPAEINARDLLARIEGVELKTIDGLPSGPLDRYLSLNELQSVLDRLYAGEEIAIHPDELGHQSGRMGAVLSQVPNVEVLTDPPRVVISDRTNRPLHALSEGRQSLHAVTRPPSAEGRLSERPGSGPLRRRLRELGLRVERTRDAATFIVEGCAVSLGPYTPIDHQLDDLVARFASSILQFRVRVWFASRFPGSRTKRREDGLDVELDGVTLARITASSVQIAGSEGLGPRIPCDVLAFDGLGSVFGQEPAARTLVRSPATGSVDGDQVVAAAPPGAIDTTPSTQPTLAPPAITVESDSARRATPSGGIPRADEPGVARVLRTFPAGTPQYLLDAALMASQRLRSDRRAAFEVPAEIRNGSDVCRIEPVRVIEEQRRFGSTVRRVEVPFYWKGIDGNLVGSLRLLGPNDPVPLVLEQVSDESVVPQAWHDALVWFAELVCTEPGPRSAPPTHRPASTVDRLPGSTPTRVLRPVLAAADGDGYPAPDSDDRGEASMAYGMLAPTRGTAALLQSSQVVGHLRLLLPGHAASQEATMRAAKIGIKLDLEHTWVRPHGRGNPHGTTLQFTWLGGSPNR